MLKWHEEILTKEQVKLLPLLKLFSRKFGLVGGTAIALHLGHRESVDFDLFSFHGFNNSSIKSKIIKIAPIDNVLVNKLDEYTFLIKGVKITFFHYLYDIDYDCSFNGWIKFPNLLTLAAMKAFALGQRAKWKDYVDLYFIKDHYSIQEIIKQGKRIFGAEFNEKLFRSQLVYFKDINYSEKVIFRNGFEVKDEAVKKGLIKFSLDKS